VAADESGGCREVWWLQRNLLAAEESGGYRRQLAAGKSSGYRRLWWLQRTLVAAEKSVGCRVSQESWGHIRTVSSISNMAGTGSVGTCIDGQYCGE
jgi:hypothetical protein